MKGTCVRIVDLWMLGLLFGKMDGRMGGVRNE